MEFRIKNETVQEINGLTPPAFPKYTTQLMNLANQNAGGTRPKVVGQMSELFPEYLRQADAVSREAWAAYYERGHEENIREAVHKIAAQVENLKAAVALIDEAMIERWVRDLLIDKTYDGMYLQKAILQTLSEIKGAPYRMADKREEALGIDGYVGDTAYSVKPDTYKEMQRLPEAIPYKMIYYTKTKQGLNVEVEE